MNHNLNLVMSLLGVSRNICFTPPLCWVRWVAIGKGSIGSFLERLLWQGSSISQMDDMFCIILENGRSKIWWIFDRRWYRKKNSGIAWP